MHRGSLDSNNSSSVLVVCQSVDFRSGARIPMNSALHLQRSSLAEITLVSEHVNLPEFIVAKFLEVCPGESRIVFSNRRLG